jgi:hypothetical protein
MAKHIADSGAHLSLDEVIDQKEDIDKALLIMYSEDNVTYQSMFVGMSKDEVEEEMLMRMDESDKTHTLLLLTAVEAMFRLDAEERYRRKNKDPLSRKIKEIYRTRVNIKLEDHLIAARIEVEPSMKRYLDALKGAFKYRHWLAHGRYWESNIPEIKNRRYDFTNIRLIISSVVSSSEFKDITN